MERVNLKELVSALDVKASREVGAEEYVDLFCTDTREEVEGGLFIALKGPNFNGHDFVKTALAKGAKAVLVSEDITANDALVLKTEDMERTLMQIARFYRNMLGIVVVGVTGSVGKTSTKDMIASVLQEKFRVVKTPENLNNEIGVFKTITGATSQDEVVVVEMGMRGAGEIELISEGVEPDIAVITKIGVAHLEFLKTRENIFKAKMEIVSGLKPGGVLVLNADDDFLKGVVLKDHKVVLCGRHNKAAQIKGGQLQTKADGMEFCIEDDGQKFEAFLPAWGSHNLQNALLAYAVGKQLGEESTQILNGLRGFVPSGARQKVVQKAGVSYVLDYYNASPDSVEAALTTLCEGDDKNARKIFVFADMSELGEISKEAHQKVGRLSAKLGVDYLLCTGEMAKFTVEAALAAEIGFARWFNSKQELAEAARSLAEPGAVVWVKGSRCMQLETLKLWEEPEANS